MSAIRGIYEVTIEVRDTRHPTPQPGLFNGLLDSTLSRTPSSGSIRQAALLELLAAATETRIVAADLG
jgi:hypothetical protein